MITRHIDLQSPLISLPTFPPITSTHLLLYFFTISLRLSPPLLQRPLQTKRAGLVPPINRKTLVVRRVHAIPEGVLLDGEGAVVEIVVPIPLKAIIINSAQNCQILKLSVGPEEIRPVARRHEGLCLYSACDIDYR